jgi:hypothetical protein
MQRYRSRAFQLGIAIATVIATTSASLACGNAMLFPLLFRAYPQTKVVYDAEMDARRQGQLSPPVWSRDLGPTYHQWSLARAEKAVKELGARLHHTALSKQIGGVPTIKVLLTNEIYTANFEPRANKAELGPLMTGNKHRRPDLYTSANVIRALLDGKVGWKDALDKKLVVLTGSSDATAQHLEELLAASFSMKQANAGEY